MQIELRLKQFLKLYGLDTHGFRKELAKACKVHRHTIGALLTNEISNPSLKVLSNICRWILVKKKSDIEKGLFDPSILPGALFGSRESKLWLAFGKSRWVTIYLGEYQQAHRDLPHVPAHRSVSRRDAEVASMFTGRLSSTSDMGQYRPSVHTRFIPFHYTWNQPCQEGCEFDKDRDRATRTFDREILPRNPEESVILLGSQRANYLVECTVANLFGCQPFSPASGPPVVPFYLCYRDFDRTVRSCFGGDVFPPNFEDWNPELYQKTCDEARKKKQFDKKHPPSIPGTYFLKDKEGPWDLCPWIPAKEDAGIVIIVRREGRMEMSVVGFSGSATVALGRHLIEYPWEFWPLRSDPENLTEEEKESDKYSDKAATTTASGLEIGVYVCRVKFEPKDKSKRTGDDDDEEDYKASVEEVIPLPFWN